MSGFIFQWPAALSLLLLSLPLVWMLAHARKQRLRLIKAMGGGQPKHRRLRDVLRVSAFILLVLALARPGYNPHTESTSRSGRDVVFAIDVSQSMLAEDVSPSRLEVAKQGVRDALYTYGNERVGLIVYAGSASILCPLTYDYDFVRYMLDQANTRTVDFGGTTLQSAVEKAVDQVFIDGRDGVQDLIVMTDGGDHGSVITKTIDLLNEKGVDTLLIGLGSPHEGAPIKIKDEEGNTKLLEYNGNPVYTKLDDAALRDFAAQSTRVEYLPFGTQPFNLGQVYLDYAKDKQVDAADSENGITIYQEAALFFLIPALLLLLLSECWGVRGLQLGQALILFGCLGAPIESKATDSFEMTYEAALTTLESGEHEEANALFNELYTAASARNATPEQLAAIQYNRGLTLLALSKTQETPQLALRFTEDAQLLFLQAKRNTPALDIAGQQIQHTSELAAELKIQIEALEKQNEQLNEQMETLVARLKALLETQSTLRGDVETSQKEANEQTHLQAYFKRQTAARLDAQVIRELMSTIDTSLKAQPSDTPTQDTLMAEPIKLMIRAQISQETAGLHLKQVETWPLSRELLLDVERLIEGILELLSNDSQQDSSDSEDWDEYDEEYDDMGESEESMSSSEDMSGDFSAGSEMQELPIPNYSAEDILLEEQGSQQFRQQKRASANAAKVEKDF
ncbi:MAG: VWA domain-containing protein [Opitutaceae bacterium]